MLLFAMFVCYHEAKILKKISISTIIFKVKLLICEYLVNSDRANIIIAINKISLIRAFKLNIYILPWAILKVKLRVMHIATVNV